MAWEPVQEVSGQGVLLGRFSTLPPEVVAWAHLPGQSPAVMWEGESKRLWQLNDRGRKTFSEIADLIEEQL